MGDVPRDGKGAVAKLCMAVHQNALPDTVEALIQSGCDVNEKDSRMADSTPLHAAVLGRNIELARVLLKHGANPNAKNRAGMTPLHMSFLNNSPSMELVLLLMRKGANPDVVGKDGRKPEDFDKNRLILRAKAKIEEIKRRGKDDLKELEEDAKRDEEESRREKDELKAYKFALSARQEIMEREKEDEVSPIVMPVFSSRISNPDLPEFEQSTETKSQGQSSPGGRFGSLRRKASVGADPGLIRDQRKTNDHFVLLVKKGKVGPVQEILKHGYNVDLAVKAGDKMSALHYAVQDRNIGMIMILLEYGADVNVQNAKKETPMHLILHSLSSKEARHVIEILLQYDPVLNVKDSKGRTAESMGGKTLEKLRAKVECDRSARSASKQLSAEVHAEEIQQKQRERQEEEHHQVEAALDREADDVRKQLEQKKVDALKRREEFERRRREEQERTQEAKEREVAAAKEAARARSMAEQRAKEKVELQRKSGRESPKSPRVPHKRTYSSTKPFDEAKTLEKLRIMNDVQLSNAKKLLERRMKEGEYQLETMEQAVVDLKKRKKAAQAMQWATEKSQEHSAIGGTIQKEVQDYRQLLADEDGLAARKASIKAALKELKGLYQEENQKLDSFIERKAELIAIQHEKLRGAGLFFSSEMLQELNHVDGLPPDDVRDYEDVSGVKRPRQLVHLDTAVADLLLDDAELEIDLQDLKALAQFTEEENDQCVKLLKAAKARRDEIEVLEAQDHIRELSDALLG